MDASSLYKKAMDALKVKDFAEAEKISKEMWIKSDADLVRKKIEQARAKQG